MVLVAMLSAPSSTPLPSLPVLNGRCYITELDAIQHRWCCSPGANPLPFSSAGECSPARESDQLIGEVLLLSAHTCQLEGVALMKASSTTACYGRRR